MRIALFILLGAFACLSFVSNYTEKELVGTWVNTEYDSVEGVWGYSITFNPAHSFRQITFLDSSYDQDSIIYDGAYLLRNDSLFLTYLHPWENEACLITELTDKLLIFSNTLDKKEVSFQLTKK
ncbi:MAG: hypothetical protein ACO1PI_13240 [Bacteroidota bacterium]